MKRLFSLVAFLALVSSPAAAKTCVCHVEGTDETHLILVSDSAVPAHVELHGDCVVMDQDDCNGEDDLCDPTDVEPADGICDNN